MTYDFINKTFAFAMGAENMPNGDEDIYCVHCGTQLQVCDCKEVLGCQEILYLVRCLKCKIAVITKAPFPRAAAKRTIGSDIPEETEWCGNCSDEVSLLWDVKKNGYKAFCPVCGKRLMLCNACQHRNGELRDDCDYNDDTDDCRYNTRFGALDLEYAKDKFEADSIDETIEIIRALDDGNGDIDDIINRYEDAQEI